MANRLMSADEVRQEIALPLLGALKADIAAAQRYANATGETVRIVCGMLAVIVRPKIGRTLHCNIPTPIKLEA